MDSYTSISDIDDDDFDILSIPIDVVYVTALLDSDDEDDDDDDDDDEIMLLLSEAAMASAGAAELCMINQHEIIIQPEVTNWGGSVKGKKPNKNRGFVAAYKKLVGDYFSGSDSVYDEVDFERRFAQPRSLFVQVYEGCINKPPFVLYKDGVTGKQGIHPLNRITGCLRFLSYGCAYDADDEYVRISESTMLDSVRVFLRIIKQQFGDSFLNRNPTEEEKNYVLSINKKRGFPGMFASWDCTHFDWDKCPTEWAGAYKSRKGTKTIILEAVVDHNLYIWNSNFGSAGSMNDINVLDKSSIYEDIVTGRFNIKTRPYNINGVYRDYMYFLVDGIYPKYAIFQSTGNSEGNEMERLFSVQQEAARKDVERVFAVLHCKYQILHRPFRGWEIGDIMDIIQACIILHNMVVDKRVKKKQEDEIQLDNNNADVVGHNHVITIFDNNLHATHIQKVTTIENAIEDEVLHHDLKADLMEHISENIDAIHIYALEHTANMQQLGYTGVVDEE